MRNATEYISSRFDQQKKDVVKLRTEVIWNYGEERNKEENERENKAYGNYVIWPKSQSTGTHIG